MWFSAPLPALVLLKYDVNIPHYWSFHCSQRERFFTYFVLLLIWARIMIICVFFTDHAWLLPVSSRWTLRPWKPKPIHWMAKSLPQRMTTHLTCNVGPITTHKILMIIHIWCSQCAYFSRTLIGRKLLFMWTSLIIIVSLRMQPIRWQPVAAVRWRVWIFINY
jgi:hypothetical protein